MSLNLLVGMTNLYGYVTNNNHDIIFCWEHRFVYGSIQQF